MNESKEVPVKMFLPHGTRIIVNGITVKILGDALIETMADKVPFIFDIKQEPTFKVHMPIAH